MGWTLAAHYQQLIQMLTDSKEDVRLYIFMQTNRKNIQVLQPLTM